MPFPEFIETLCSIPDAEANIHFKSQHRVVCRPAADGKQIMADFIGRFENLADDFDLVAARIGAPELELPHLWRSEGRRSRPYREFYDDGLKDLVHERYREDTEVFEYTF